MYEQLDEFIERARDAVAGRLGGDEETSLRGEIYNAYRMDRRSMQTAKVAINDKPWPQVLAALRAYRDTLEHELAVANATAGNISVNASAEAIAKASFDVNDAIYFATRVVEASDMTTEQKGELQQLMLDTKNSARKGPRAFAEKAAELLRKAGEYTAPLAEIIAIIQAAVQLLPQMQP